MVFHVQLLKYNTSVLRVSLKGPLLTTSNNRMLVEYQEKKNSKRQCDIYTQTRTVRLIIKRLIEETIIFKYEILDPGYIILLVQASNN